MFRVIVLAVTADEIRALWFHFKEISSSVSDDDLIDKKYVARLVFVEHCFIIA